MRYIVNIVLCICFFEWELKAQELKRMRQKFRNHYRPQMLSFFNGYISEDENKVRLNSPIFALDKDAPHLSGKICDYKIYTNERTLPFTIEVLNKTTGEAEIIRKNIKKNLNCAINPKYEFEISAIDCGNGHQEFQLESLRSSVTVKVVDVNDHVPVFNKSLYEVHVYKSIKQKQTILKVEANDGDCMATYNKICEYTLKGSYANLFHIDNKGKITSTKSLQGNVRITKYILYVTAYDCVGSHSEPSKVEIFVYSNCKPEWCGVNNRVEYSSLRNSKEVNLFPQASLKTCVEESLVQTISINVELDTSLIGKGCDRDTRIPEQKSKICGNGDNVAFDVMPSVEDYNLMLENEDITDTSISSLPVLKQGHFLESERIFEFNGIDQVFNVSQKSINLPFIRKFSVSFWLKLLNVTKMHQTILSKSSLHELNHHELLIYVKNCMMNFELYDKESNIKHQWHWKLQSHQMCDSLWHHYVINFEYPTSSLFVDGEFLQTKPPVLKHSSVILNDGLNYAWFIGACWQGKHEKFGQHYNGYIADLTLNTETITSNVVKCFTNCEEGLTINSKNFKKIPFNFSKFHFVANISDKKNLLKANKVMSHLAYQNNRTFPTPMERLLTIHTNIVCKNGTKICPKIPDVKSYIIVLHPPDPTFAISGIDHIARSANDLQHGIYIFHDISIWAAIQDNSFGDSIGGLIVHEFDVCMVKIEGGKMLSEEILFVRPQSIIEDSNLTLSTVEDGIQSLATYEKVLRSVVYQHSLPKDVSDKQFTMQCSDLNGRFKSNKHVLNLSILHPVILQSTENNEKTKDIKEIHKNGENIITSFKNVENKPHWKQKDEKHFNLQAAIKSDDSYNTLPVIIVGICLGLLVFLISAMMIQTHLYQQGEDKTPIMEEDFYNSSKTNISNLNEQDLDWEDSALTVTVNPLERQGFASDFSENEVSDLEYEDFDEKRQLFQTKRKDIN